MKLHPSDALLFITLMLSFNSALARVCFISVTAEECTPATNCYQWPISFQILTEGNCVEVRLSTEIYLLQENLIIAKIKNFSLVGNGSVFVCKNEERFALLIHDSNFVQISNIKFINCGYDVNYKAGLISSPTSSVIHIQNSSSVTITNASFENSCGHAVTAVNTFGESLLQNILIFHSTNTKHCVKTLGGIFWLNKHVNGLNSIKHKTLTLSLRHCTIHNIAIPQKHLDANKSLHYKRSSSLIHIILQHDFNNYLQAAVNMFNINITNVTSISHSLVLVSNFIVNSSILLSNSHFSDNTVASVFSMITSPNTTKLLTVNNTLFYNNIVHNKLFSVLHASPKIEGAVSFFQNIANVIISVSDYIVMGEKSTLEFYNNQYNPSVALIKRFIIERLNKSLWCPVQFTKKAYTNSNISFCNNTRYYKEVYADFFLHDCTWNTMPYLNLSAVHVYEMVMHMCKNVQRTFSFGRGGMICQCDREDNTCLDFKLDPVSLGQTITVNMVHPRFNISVFPDFTSKTFTNVAPTCELAQYNTSHPKVNLVLQQCTKLSFTIISNSTQLKKCILVLKTATMKNFITAISIPIKDCPIGFTLNSYSQVCQCNPKLSAALKTVTCRISDGKIKPPPNCWISAIQIGNNRSDFVYSKSCTISYCLKKIHFVSLKNPDTQCVPGRTGLACGQCRNGLSSIFGSPECKQCSNYGLFLIAFFAIAGVVVIILLFSLNLTVVHGDIYGFLMFVNVLSDNIYVRHVTLALFNLDLGIEVCFYNGMTAYVATWLEYVFPFYLLCIVAGLVMASRYSVKIEKLTRQKVIPVIATLLLFSYNKIMTVTFNALFAYQTVYHLYSGKTEMYWTKDTGITLFGVWHLLLVIFCIVVLLFVIIPINALLIYAKVFYRFRIIVTRLKPFIDAYTAPLKDHHRYFLGLEFLIRATVYIIRHVWPNYTAIIYGAIAILYIAYLCKFQPFKQSINNFIYTMYVICLSFICLLFLHYSVLNTEPQRHYMTLVCIIIYSAIAVFALIVAYHIWRYILCHYKMFIKLESLLLKIKLKYLQKLGITQKPTSNGMQRSLNRYEEYQEELLAMDDL